MGINSFTLTEYKDSSVYLDNLNTNKMTSALLKENFASIPGMLFVVFYNGYHHIVDLASLTWMGRNLAKRYILNNTLHYRTSTETYNAKKKCPCGIFTSLDM